MKCDYFCKTMLAIIATLLAALAFRPFFSPSPVAAQSEEAGWLFFEPGVTTIRSPDNRTQVLGKVAVDLRNGNVWGFPTLQNDPYPRDVTQTKPPVSNPLYLGRYNLQSVRTKGE
jgi:hypothetical protein